MKRGVRNFLRGRLDEIDRKLSHLRTQQRSVRDWEPVATRTSYSHRVRRLEKMRQVILNPLSNEDQS